MKNFVITILTIFTTISAFGQNFEGKIFYSTSYKSKNPKMTDEQLTTMMGSKEEFLIKNGDYKTISNGNLLQWQLFINKDNKLYTKMSNSEVVYWNDASVQDDEILKAEINKNAIEILGYKCDEVILTCKSGVQKYYFNSKLAVDPKLFINHKFGNWYEYLSKAKALPLKSIIDNSEFTLTLVATEVKPMKLESKTFELPAGVKTEKSPY